MRYIKCLFQLENCEFGNLTIFKVLTFEPKGRLINIINCFHHGLRSYQSGPGSGGLMQ